MDKERMRPIMAERSAVKLVHPGRYVEILREPITAAEVMSKNPRHCITRPDVFKFPWVVIKPESVLPLGKVFFLVPNRTLYELTKSENHRNNSLRDRSNQATPPKTPSPAKAFAGVTPKHRDNHRHHNHHDHPSRRLNNIPRVHDGAAGSASEEIADRRSTESDSDWEERLFLSSWMGGRNSYWQLRQQLSWEPVGGSNSSATTSMTASILAYNNISSSRSSTSSGGNEESARLKSCLRKPDSARKSLGLRVSFMLPSRDNKEERPLERQRNTGARRPLRISICFKCS